MWPSALAMNVLPTPTGPRMQTCRCASKKRRLTSSLSTFLSNETFALLSQSSRRIDGSTPASVARLSAAALSRREISSVRIIKSSSSKPISCLSVSTSLSGSVVAAMRPSLRRLSASTRSGLRSGVVADIRRPPRCPSPSWSSRRRALSRTAPTGARSVGAGAARPCFQTEERSLRRRFQHGGDPRHVDDIESRALWHIASTRPSPYFSQSGSSAYAWRILVHGRGPSRRRSA